jgi:hypothetical protein
MNADELFGVEDPEEKARRSREGMARSIIKLAEEKGCSVDEACAELVTSAAVFSVIIRDRNNPEPDLGMTITILQAYRELITRQQEKITAERLQGKGETIQ